MESDTFEAVLVATTLTGLPCIHGDRAAFQLLLECEQVLSVDFGRVDADGSVTSCHNTKN